MIDMTRRQFGLGILGGMASLLLKDLPSAQAQPTPPPVPAGDDLPEPIAVKDAGDHVTRLHLNMADGNEDGEVIGEEWNGYRATLETPANLTGYRLGDLPQMREGIARFDQARRFGISSLGRMAASTVLEVVITEPWNKWPLFTCWAASLGEAYYYSPFNFSLLQWGLLSTPCLTFEHWIGGVAGRRVYDFLYGRKVLDIPLGPEIQVPRVLVSNIVRETVHYGINLVVDVVPPQKNGFILF